MNTMRMRRCLFKRIEQLDNGAYALIFDNKQQRDNAAKYINNYQINQARLALQQVVTFTETALFEHKETIFKINPNHTEKERKHPTDKTNINHGDDKQVVDPFTVIDIPLGMRLEDRGGDGNCMFLSVGHLLGMHQMTLRKRLGDLITEQRGVITIRENLNGEIISSHMNMFELIPDFDVEEYVAQLTTNGNWGDHFVLAAMTALFPNLCIHVHQVSGVEIIGTGDLVVHIAYAGLHYRAVVMD